MASAGVPVTVLTGFLGSGKTTLLAALLRSPALARTAVVINEFGEIGLDHDLVAAADESFVTLQTGCLCCSIRGDLVLTLEDLLARRARGEIMDFERIVIETSGLADPAPILQALMAEPSLDQMAHLAGVVTVVDAVLGAATLDRQPEAVKQVAVADRLILTKTDAAPTEPRALLNQIAVLNPTAAVHVAVRGGIDPALVLGGSAAPRVAEPDRGHAHAHTHHDAAIGSFAIVREAPLPAVALTLLLEILAEHCGADLLRMKGLVAIAESPDRPAVVHGVQHVFSAPEFLDGWPSADRRTRLVFIGRHLSPRWLEAVMTAIEAEVVEVAQDASLVVPATRRPPIG